ncbi:MAG: hypothetical protein VXZ82_01945 [Planctomycetota bacterium]|nr:hypothetical protein [Planctomycetota bacterium]
MLRDFLRGRVREVISKVMAAEVTELGRSKRYPPSLWDFHAATASGCVLMEGAKGKVFCSRDRQRAADGTSRKVELTSYTVANDPQLL